MSKIKTCSFCGSPLAKHNKGIEGIGAVICHQCLALYSEISKNTDYFKDKKTPNKFLKDQFTNSVPISPKYLYDEISKTVIGQDKAKKVLSVALYRHYKRMIGKDCSSKANILLIGPTGVGKTLLAKTMASILSIPIAICDATVYTEAGYVGEDVENILLKLIQNADYDLDKAKYGIVFIDEFDKIARKSENPSITRDVSGEGVQNSLLKIIEGNVINIPPNGGRKHPYQEYISFDTSNVLFICAGAFDGLNLNTKKTIGFTKSVDLIKSDITKALEKYGIIPEILGRLPVIATLDDLSCSELVKILLLPRHALVPEYKKIFQEDEVKLDFSEDAIKEIARLAKSSGLGARALRKILEKMMLDYMFNIPSDNDIKEIMINKEDVSRLICDDIA